MTETFPVNALAAAWRTAARRFSEATPLVEETLPSDWRALNTEGSRKLVLGSRSWTSSSIQRLRFTEIEGPTDLYIANIGLLPRPESNLPVMHAEVVVIAARLRVLILDLKPLDEASDVDIAPLIALRNRLTAVELAGERPEWAVDAISTDALWGHGDTPAALADACDALLSFTNLGESVLRAGRHTVEGDRIASRTDKLHRLRSAFLLNEPSRPFLRATFGADWAERYITDFLFPIAAPFPNHWQDVNVQGGVDACA